MNKTSMDKRKSGLKLIGTLKWGNSFCQLFRNRKELLEILGPYLKTGLQNNELCIVVIGDKPAQKDHLPALQRAIPDWETYLERGQLEIIPLKQWVPRGFKSHKPLTARWDKAISRSYDGLRLAFAFSANDPKMVSISSEVDRELGNFSAIACYCFPRDCFDAVGLMEIVKYHQIALTKNGGKWEALKSSEARVAHSALRRSEETLQSLFDHMAEGFAHHRILLDPGGRPRDYVFLQVNPAFERIVGLRAKDVIGKRVTRVLPGIENDPADWIGKYGKVALSGKADRFESYSALLNRWFQVSAFSPQKGFFSVIFTDITERKDQDYKKQALLEKVQTMAVELQASNEELRDTSEELQTANEELKQQTDELSNLNQALFESEQRFSSAFQASPAALSISNLEDGRFIDVNESFERLFGYDREDLIGRLPVRLYNNPDDRVEMVRKLFNTGVVRNYEVMARTKTGRDINVLVSAVVTEINKKKSVLWTSLDITERKKAQDILAKANDQLETEVKERTAQVVQERQRLFNVLETLPAMICLLTPDHQITFANRSFRDAFGEARGRQCFEWCFGRSAPCEFCESYLALQTGRPHHWEVASPDGRVFEAYDFPFTDIDGSPMILEMEMDITERKRTEARLKELNETLEQRVANRTAELESANRELESFSYSVSHDLRAPLRALDGFSQMALEDYGDKLGEAGRDYLDRIRNASHTMSELIEAILKLARITRAEMHHDRVNLSDLARSIAEGLKQSQPDRQAEFIIQPNVVVRGDLELLRVALNNLLENAWKYTGKCPVTRIELGTIAQKGLRVYFVKDNGVGFDMQYQEKLFQPFQRLHSSKEYPGTGIGLATVQRVIRRHNGRIWAESEIGQGTTISFTLD